MKTATTKKCTPLTIKPLTVQQLNAIDLLVTGKNDRETAETLGLERATVTRWRMYHPGFIAELNKSRAAAWSAGGDQFRSLLVDAVSVLAEKLKEPGEEQGKLALALLKRFGGPTLVFGPTETEGVLAPKINAKIQAKAEARQKYTSQTDMVFQSIDPAHARKIDEADAREAREEVMAELAALLDAVSETSANPDASPVTTAAKAA